MLSRHSMKTPIWPYIAVVACLFVLSLLAPHAWLRPELSHTQTSDVGQSEDHISTQLESTAVAAPIPHAANAVEPEWNAPRLTAKVEPAKVEATLTPELPPVLRSNTTA